MRDPLYLEEIGMGENSSGDRDVQETRDLIETWLRQADWKVEAIPAADISWGFNAEIQQGKTVSVLQSTKYADGILIRAIVQVHDSHQQQLGRLSQKERANFLWEMQSTLLQMGLLFDGIADPLRRIAIAQRIYYDGLTKDTFFQRFSAVSNGLFLVLGMIAKKLAHPLPGGQNIH
jgi:hypothetical protein